MPETIIPHVPECGCWTNPETGYFEACPEHEARQQIPDPCVQCGSAEHDHFDCPCNCLLDTNASCPIHSFGGKF